MSMGSIQDQDWRNAKAKAAYDARTYTIRNGASSLTTSRRVFDKAGDRVNGKAEADRSELSFIRSVFTTLFIAAVVAVVIAL